VDQNFQKLSVLKRFAGGGSLLHFLRSFSAVGQEILDSFCGIRTDAAERISQIGERIDPMFFASGYVCDRLTGAEYILTH
jgi:hypothetical protein